MQTKEVQEIMDSIDMSKYEQLSLAERKNLLMEILLDVKKYKYCKLDDPRKKVLLSEDMDELYRDIFNNHNLIKSDSGIILNIGKIVKNNLSTEENLYNLNRQRKLLNLMYSMNSYLLIPMFNSKSTVMAYDRKDIANSLLINTCEVKVNEDTSITKEAVNDNISEKHSEILQLAKQIRIKNL